MPVDVTVAKTQNNIVKWLQSYVNMYLFDEIHIRDLTRWGSLLARKSIVAHTERCQMAQNDQE